MKEEPLNELELDALLRWSHKKHAQTSQLTKAEELVIRLLHHGYMPQWAEGEPSLVTEPTAPLVIEEW